LHHKQTASKPVRNCFVYTRHAFLSEAMTLKEQNCFCNFSLLAAVV